MWCCSPMSNIKIVSKNSKNNYPIFGKFDLKIKKKSKKQMKYLNMRIND